MEIEQHSDRLVLRVDPTTQEMISHIDARGAGRPMLLQRIIAAYMTGADRIHVRHDDPASVQEGTTGLLGMALVAHDEHVSEIATLLKVPEDSTEQLLRRAGHMLDRQADLLVEVANGRLKAEELRAQELLLDSTIRYCVRFLHKYAQENADYKHFLLLDTFERAADQIRAVAKRIGSDDALATHIQRNVRNYTKKLFSGDAEQLHADLRAFRDGIAQETFVHGLAFTLAELLYDNVLYVGN